MLILAILLSVLATTYADRDKLPGNLNVVNFLQFPQPDNLNTPDFDESQFGNPAIMDISPIDGLLYTSLFGVFTTQIFPTNKGIGRVNADGTFEVIVEFPELGGIVEKIWFDENGFLFVNLAMYFDRTQAVTNGIVKVDIAAGTYEQIWNGDHLFFPAGITRDDNGNFYVTDAALGHIWKIDSNGNGVLWASDPVLFSPDPFGQGNPSSVNGIAWSSKKQKLFAVVLGSGQLFTLEEDPVTGLAATPELISDHPLLFTADQIEFDEDEKILFSGCLGTGAVIRINTQKNPVSVQTIAQFVQGEIVVDAVPAFRYHDPTYRTSVFTQDIGFVTGGLNAGAIYRLDPVCDGPGRCDWY